MVLMATVCHDALFLIAVYTIIFDDTFIGLDAPQTGSARLHGIVRQLNELGLTPCRVQHHSEGSIRIAVLDW